MDERGLRQLIVLLIKIMKEDHQYRPYAGSGPFPFASSGQGFTARLKPVP
jgi:hypothetical protein